MNKKHSVHELRLFGYICGSAMILWAVIATIRGHRGVSVVLVIVGLFLIQAAFFNPVWVRPIHKIFSFIMHCINSVLTIILFSLLFYCIITPIGFLLRLIGKHPLDVTFDKKVTSYWEDIPTKQEMPQKYEKQF